MNSSISKDGNFKTLKAVNDINQVLISNSATIKTATITNLNYVNPYFCQLSKNTSTNNSAKVIGFASTNPNGFNNLLGNMADDINGKIIIKKAGYYKVKLFGVNVNSDYGTPIYLYINGQEYAVAVSARNYNATITSSTIDLIIVLNMNDFLEFYTANVSYYIGGNTPSSYCYISAEYLGF